MYLNAAGVPVRPPTWWLKARLSKSSIKEKPGRNGKGGPFEGVIEFSVTLN